MKIGPRIRAARKARTFSQEELARRVGVKQSSVSDWENDRTEPTVDNLRIIAVELGVWFEWLVTGRGPMDYSPRVEQQSPEYRVENAPPQDEVELLDLFRHITEERREALIEFLKKWK